MENIFKEFPFTWIRYPLNLIHAFKYRKIINEIFSFKANITYIFYQLVALSENAFAYSNTKGLILLLKACVPHSYV